MKIFVKKVSLFFMFCTNKVKEGEVIEENQLLLLHHPDFLSTTKAKNNYQNQKQEKQNITLLASNKMPFMTKSKENEGERKDQDFSREKLGRQAGAF
jgi:hypothetical protein